MLIIANARVLDKIGIRECLEREEDIDPAYRFALQKYVKRKCEARTAR